MPINPLTLNHSRANKKLNCLPDASLAGLCAYSTRVIAPLLTPDWPAARVPCCHLVSAFTIVIFSSQNHQCRYANSHDAIREENPLELSEKLEWLGYNLVKVAWWSTQSFGHNTSTWQTHRQPRRHSKCRPVRWKIIKNNNNKIIYQLPIQYGPSDQNMLLVTIAGGT